MKLKAAFFYALVAVLSVPLSLWAMVDIGGGRIKDWKCAGCRMSPGSAGAPASGANKPGGNQAYCAACNDSKGMARWWISEPEINLFISDTPLSYFGSSSETSFRWTYKQRFTLPLGDECADYYMIAGDTNYFRSGNDHYLQWAHKMGTTNAAWSHNWQMDIVFWDSNWEIAQKNWNNNNRYGRAPIMYSNSWEALLFRSTGDVMYFSFGGFPDGLTQINLQPASGSLNLVITNPPTPDATGIYWGDPGNGFTLTYPDGSQDIFGLALYLNSGTWTSKGDPESTARAFLTQRIDPQGRKTLLGYELTPYTNFWTYQITYIPAYYGMRLKYVVDSDGKTNTFYYNQSTTPPTAPLHPWQVVEVDDPYGRKAQFGYATNGLLTSITDAVSNVSSFAYQGTNGWITNLVTPYGTNSFTFYQVPDTNWPSGYSQRATYVSEPEGAHQLFCFLFQNTLLSTSSIPPVVPGQNFDCGTNGASKFTLDYRNSFHWDRRQFTALSTNATSWLPNNLSNAVANLTAADFRKGWLQHWLLSAGDLATITESLSSEREPSPDAGGLIEGPRTWLNYANKPTGAPEQDGNAQVTCIARLLPDGSSQYVTYNYNALFPALVTDNEETYSKQDGTVGVRTNFFQYPYSQIPEVDLTSVSNSFGQFLTFAYNTHHQVTFVTNALLQVTSFGWNSTTHNLTNVTLPSGESLGLSYAGLLSQVNLSPQGRTIQVATYTNGLPQVLRETGTGLPDLWVTNFWDALNRLTATSFTDGTSVSNVYNRLALGAIKDRLGNWACFGYDGLEHLVSITDARSNVTYLSWCDCGALASVTDPLTNTTLFNYNNQGLLTNILFADYSSITYSYDAISRLTNVADGLGSLAAIYNSQGLLTSIRNAYGSVFGVVYDALDRPVQVSDANGLTITNTFDPLDRLLTRTWPGGSIEGFLWSTNGLVACTNQNRRVTFFTRDAAGRITGVTNANLEAIGLSYNAFGQVTDLWDGRTNHTIFHFNQYGWLTNKVDGLGHEVLRLTYNPNGYVTNRWTPQSTNTVYAYDSAGNLTNITYIGSTTPSVAYVYDAANRLKNVVDSLGTHTLGYTPLGQLQTEIGSWTSEGVTNIYSHQLRQNLNLAQPGGGVWAQAFGYDSAWRLQSLASPAGSFTYGYKIGSATSPASLVRTLNLPNGTWVTNHFDSLDRLDYTALINSWGHVLDGYAYAHDLLGLRTNITRFLGMTTNTVVVGYDNIGQVVSWIGTESSGAVRQNEQFGFGFDQAGNLRSRTNGALVQAFTSDPANELTNVTRTGNFTLSGSTAAPVTNLSVNGFSATTYGDLSFAATNLSLFNGPNSFTNIAKNAFGTSSTNIVAVDLPTHVALQFDWNGNLTNDGTRSFIYDSENRLVTNSVAGAWKTEFVYDGLGRRRIERDYGWAGTWNKTNELHFIYDGWLLIQVRDTNNNVLVTYTRGLDLSTTFAGAGGIGGLLARTDSTGSAYYHSDGSGNITALIDNYQIIRARYEYSPFGRLVGKWGVLADANEMQFSSMPVNRLSGMQHFLGREYGTDWQGWFQRDPIGEVGGINLYRFNRNNPLSYVDPYGLNWIDDFGDWELNRLADIKRFFVGDPGQIRPADEGLRAGSGLIEPLRDKEGNDVTADTLLELATTPLMAVLGGPERESLTIFGDAVKCKRAAKVFKESASLWEASRASRGFKSFEELKKFLGPAGEGKQWHHIVEQSKIDQFGAAAIHNVDNVIAIPEGLNIKLNAFYQTKNPLTGGLSPREWLSGKTLQQNYDFGRAALYYVGEGVW